MHLASSITWIWAPESSKTNLKKWEENEAAVRKTPDVLYRQTQRTNAGFADRRPCWSVLIIETRNECDKEKLRRDKNVTAKVRLLLFCQGTKSRGSEKTQWGIIAKPLDKLINTSDEQCSLARRRQEMDTTSSSKQKSGNRGINSSIGVQNWKQKSFLI